MIKKIPKGGTPDGISQRDWEKIHKLACDIVNARDSDGNPTKGHDPAVSRMIKTLDRLDKKYGPKPSVLATKADFLDDPQERIHLYEHAYSLATEIGDKANLTLISDSLVSLFWDELKDKDQTIFWLSNLETSLKNHHDDLAYELFVRIDREIKSKDS